MNKPSEKSLEKAREIIDRVNTAKENSLRSFGDKMAIVQTGKMIHEIALALDAKDTQGITVPRDVLEECKLLIAYQSNDYSSDITGKPNRRRQALAKLEALLEGK